MPEDAGLGDRASMAFAGTLVTNGTGSGMVVATGARTELGKISELLEEAVDLETPLTRALGEMGRAITIGILAVTAVMLAIGVARTMLQTDVGLIEALRETVIFAIALAVGAIPEGLPAIVTIALAIGVQRMARRRAIVRKLPAVETLGSTTVICSDKTGTLTRNEMTVRSLATSEGRYELTGVGYEPEGSLTQHGSEVATPDRLRDLVQAAALCNDATLQHEEGRWTLIGDPTEGALVVAAEKLGYPVESLRAEHPRLDVIPFESENQWMATLHTGPDAVHRILVKGAPEAVARRCRACDLSAVQIEVERLASQGMRVLGVASSVALAESQTIAVTAIIIFQCFYLANCRSLRYSFMAVGAFRNRMFYVGVALVLILQAAFIYLPPANTLFGSAPLNFEAWIKAFVVGALILPAMIVEKRVIRAIQPSKQASGSG